VLVNQGGGTVGVRAPEDEDVVVHITCAQQQQQQQQQQQVSCGGLYYMYQGNSRVIDKKKSH
jgi:hypothetical protein